MQTDQPIRISDLFPDYTPEECEQAEENLRRYAGALLRIAERLDREGRSIADRAVDDSFDDEQHPL